MPELLLPHPQRCNERLLRNRNGAIFAHPLLPLLLLVEQLALAAGVAALAFGGGIPRQKKRTSHPPRGSLVTLFNGA